VSQSYRYAWLSHEILGCLSDFHLDSKKTQALFVRNEFFSSPLPLAHHPIAQSTFAGLSFFNSYLGSWNTSKCTDFSFMFERARSFSVWLDPWDVSGAVDFR